MHQSVAEYLLNREIVSDFPFMNSVWIISEVFGQNSGHASISTVKSDMSPCIASIRLHTIRVWLRLKQNVQVGWSMMLKNVITDPWKWGPLWEGLGCKKPNEVKKCAYVQKKKGKRWSLLTTLTVQPVFHVTKVDLHLQIFLCYKYIQKKEYLYIYLIQVE